MKIIICGNIGSGKSTLIAALQQLIGAEVIMLDSIRQAFSNGSFEGEKKAIAKALEAIKKERPQPAAAQIIETCGMGRFYNQLNRYLHIHKISTFKVLLRCHPDTCLARIRARSQLVPLPYSFRPELSVWKIHYQFKQTASQYDIILDAEKHSPEQLAQYIYAKAPLQ